jgi:hypothetical protein
MPEPPVLRAKQHRKGWEPLMIAQTRDIYIPVRIAPA